MPTGTGSLIETNFELEPKYLYSNENDYRNVKINVNLQIVKNSDEELKCNKKSEREREREREGFNRFSFQNQKQVLPSSLDEVILNN